MTHKRLFNATAVLIITTTLTGMMAPANTAVPSATSPGETAPRPSGIRGGLLREELAPDAGRVLSSPKRATSKPNAAPAARSARDVVTYTSFGGQTYTLNRFAGRHTQTLLPDTWADGSLLSDAELSRLLDSHDLTYEFYKELTGTEPQGEGPVTIAYVPLSAADNFGLGLTGFKGVEISDSRQTVEKVREELTTRATFSPVDHELAHNFDRVSGYTVRQSADSHAWTYALQAALTTRTLGTDSGVAPPESLKLKLGPLDKYQSSGLDWNAALTQRPQDSHPNHVWAGTLLKLIQLQGTSALRKYVASVLAIRSAETTPAPDSPRRDDYHFRALSSALDSNGECLADFWRWPVSTSERSSLRASYGTAPAAPCKDADTDSHSPLAGDTDDTDPAVNPASRELLNGKDDDSNYVADDTVTTESSLAPDGDLPEQLQSAPQLAFGSRVEATLASSSDVDTVKVSVPPLAQGQAEPRVLFVNSRASTQGSQVQIEILQSGGESTGIFIHSDYSRLPVRHDVRASSSQELAFRVRKSSAFPFAGPISYELSVGDATPRPPAPASTLAVAQPRTNADGTRTLTATWREDDWQELQRLGVTHVRWWVGGLGWVAETPATRTASLEWAAPTPPTKPVYSYRAQAIRRDTQSPIPSPLSLITQPSFFTHPDTGPAPQPPVAPPAPTIGRRPPNPPDARPAPSRRQTPECVAPSSIARITFTSPTTLPVAAEFAAPNSTDDRGLSHYPSSLGGWRVSFGTVAAEVMSVRRVGTDPNTLEPRVEIHALTPAAVAPPAAGITVTSADGATTSFNTCTQVIAPAIFTDESGFAVAVTSPEGARVDAEWGLPFHSLFSAPDLGRSVTIFGTGFRNAPNSTTSNDPQGLTNPAEHYNPALLLYADGSGRSASAQVVYVGPASSGPHGLDQITVVIPASAAGAGVVELHLVTAAGGQLPSVDVWAKLRLN